MQIKHYYINNKTLLFQKSEVNIDCSKSRDFIKDRYQTINFTMLPLSLLRTAQNHPMLVELKNGETYNGHLVSCDNWMNINLREVICTSRDGDRFWRMSECYVRGSTIKYLRIPDEVIYLNSRVLLMGGTEFF